MQVFQKKMSVIVTCSLEKKTLRAVKKLFLGHINGEHFGFLVSKIVNPSSFRFFHPSKHVLRIETRCFGDVIIVERRLNVCDVNI